MRWVGVMAVLCSCRWHFDAIDSGTPDLEQGATTRSSKYRDAVLADTPVGYWRLGETSGTTARNELANGLDGTVDSTVRLGVVGAFGADGDTAFELDGATGDVTIGNVLDFAGNASYTLEAWIRPTLIDTSFRRVIDKQLNNVAGYRLHVRGNLGVACGRCTSTTNCNDASSGSTPPLGVFTHVACTYDGATLTVYVNGSPTGTGTFSEAIEISSEPLRFGSRGPQTVFQGAIDEIAVYDKPLADTSIAAHYEAGL